MIPSHIVDLYIYFLYPYTKKGNDAFERFYNASHSREWVKRYAAPGKEFYSKFMTKYSQEIREQWRNHMPFQGVITPRGLSK